MTELFRLHKHGKNSSYLERLMLTEQFLPFFPTNLETIFPYLRQIVLSRNSITKLTNSYLKSHKFLLELQMDFNEINYLERNVFEGSNLLVVNLTRNHIMHIDIILRYHEHCEFISETIHASMNKEVVTKIQVVLFPAYASNVYHYRIQ